MHWMTKHTNKECHTVILVYALHNIMATLFNNHPYISSNKLNLVPTGVPLLLVMYRDMVIVE